MPTSRMLPLVLTTLLTSPLAFAGSVNHNVTANPNFTFTPNNLTIQQGDTVTFTNAGGFHNVASTGGPTTFRCANGCDGAGGSGEPAGNAWSATVTFNTPGQVTYVCQVHAGMTGVININIPVELQTFEVE